MVSDEAEPLFDGANDSPDLRTGPFDGILVDDPNQAVEALKNVQNDIANDPQRIAASSDELIRVICISSSKAFHHLDADTPQTTLRLCKHLMQTLSNFFDQKLLSVTVSREVLVLLLGELTQRLLETSSNAASDAITSLSKVLNMILIRIFHNTERSSCFG
jgi:cytoskeleton-associated protein 5